MTLSSSEINLKFHGKCLFAKETTQSFCVCASESLIYFFVSVNYWHVVGELMVLISRCFGCKKCQKAAFDSKQTSAPSIQVHFFTESIIQYSTSFLAGNLRKSNSYTILLEQWRSPQPGWSRSSVSQEWPLTKIIHFHYFRKRSPDLSRGTK